VLGTILLFLIVTAIAGSIWFMLDRVKDEAEIEDSPEIGFALVANEPAVRIIQAPADPDELDWAEDLVLGGTCTPTLNGMAYPTGPGTPVRANDVLGCDWGDTLLISSSEKQGGKLLFRHTFPGG
jgi:hypothetical protein